MKRKKIIYKGDLKEIELIKSYQFKRKEISKFLEYKIKIIFVNLASEV